MKKPADKPRQRVAKLVAAMLCSAVLPAVPTATRAQVSVTPTVVAGVALFDYDYSVANLTAFDLAIVTIDVLSRPDAILNATAPAGFLISFDPGVGQLSFLEDADPFTPETFAAGTTVSGFSFQSPFGPSPTSFTALDATGGSSIGATLAPSAVPEPDTLALSLSGALLGLAIARSRLRNERIGS